MDKPFIIAYYLPQYHPIPENDEWWGKGFTEWTNVAKAKPLFKGHYQPKIPADLGFYDLRVPEVREQQAELAREAGVDGFCYWHYWFGNGKELLERPFNEVVNSGKPDFPFCLGWANEDWQAKIWNPIGKNTIKQTLISQSYPGNNDIRQHFDTYLKAFKDARYIRIDNKPLFLIYQPFKIPNLSAFINQWNFWLKQEGIADGFYWIGTARNNDEIKLLEETKLFNSHTLMLDKRITNGYTTKNWILKKIWNFCRFISKKPLIIKYADYIKSAWDDNVDSKENFIPTILTNWDHTPRSGNNGYVLQGATPARFKQQCFNILKKVSSKNNKLVFLKSWNEWGEGNYIEPDLLYGKSFIKSLSEAKKESLL